MRSEELDELAALGHGAPGAEAEPVLDAVPTVAARVHLLIVSPESAPIKPRTVDEMSRFSERGLTTRRADKDPGLKGQSGLMLSAEPLTCGSFVTLL
jgi:hypothetical protein